MEGFGQTVEWVYTIGHSTHPFRNFVELLRHYEITAVGDVRSQPFSKFNPQYNRAELKESLASVGLSYAFMGGELGARSSDPSCYVNGRVSYARLAKTDNFKRGLDRIQDGRERHKIALLCAERDPIDCHRAILVSRFLEERGIAVAHIHSNGSMETHPQLVDRLIVRLNLPKMFLSREAVAEEAYRLRENEIAYTPQEDNKSVEGVRV